MNTEELADFIQKHAFIEYACEEDTGAMLFRDTSLPWYQKDINRATRIEKEQYNALTPEALYDEIRRGLNVEQITRITGYFTRVASWNPGKKSELQDRKRFSNIL